MDVAGHSYAVRNAVNFQIWKEEEADNSVLDKKMAFFTTSVTALKTVVTAIGAGIAVWGIINLLEGYGNDNPGANAHVR